MRRRGIAVALTAAFFLAGGCAVDSPAPGTSAAKVEPAAGTIRLTLKSTEEVFSVSQARAGEVSVIARFENLGETPILLAHPGVCAPRIPEQGETLTVDPDRSYLSLHIESPGGKTLHLRHHLLRLFAPDSRDHLQIAPGSFEEAFFGWLGPDFALGQWDGIERPIFDSPGTYQLSLSYRNTYPVAAIHTAQGETSWIEVWTGAIESNRLSVEIE